MKLHTFVAVTFLAVVLAIFGSPVSASDGRVALVIGNSEYDHVSSLQNPANDAEDIASALERIGFEVTRGRDLDYREMRLALRDFAQAAEDAEMAVVYFAGHGIEIDNINYLIPVNAELKSDRDIEFEAIRLDSVLSALDTSQGIRIVLLDACRNNPFLTSMLRSSATRSVGRGLAGVEPGAVLVGFAARGGTLALDGDGRNSPYAEALLTHLAEPGLELGFFFRKVRDTVSELTNGYQQPFTYGSLPGHGIYLTPAAAPLRAAEPVAEATGSDPVSGEDAAFEAARKLGSVRAWSLFFDKFPNGARKSEALEAEATLFRYNLQARHAGRNLAAAESLNWMRGEAVKYLTLSRANQLVIQSTLQRFGYDPGVIDGVLGPQSFGAVSDFQRDRRLAADGVLDRATLSALGIEPPEFGWFPIAATLGNRYDIEAIRALESDPRLHRLARTFSGRVMNYGFYDGRLYAVVRTSHLSWDQIKTLTMQSGGDLASIGSASEEEMVKNLFRYDNLFWTERNARDTYPFAGDDNLDVIGPTFGLTINNGVWAWTDGQPLSYRNWQPGFPRSNRPRPFGEFVHGPRRTGTLPSDWRWGNWHVARNAILIEIE